MNRAKEQWQGQLSRFVLVGLINTLCGLVTLFAFYDGLGMGYWGASALSYFLCSILSYVLNRRFTFGHEGALASSMFRFALNIAACYFLAYALAKPLVLAFLARVGWGLDLAWAERLALLTGMVLFTALNFIGQKFFVFSRSNTM